jgi:hypothetical protein
MKKKSVVNKAPAVYIFYGCGELVFLVARLPSTCGKGLLTDILLQFFSLSISTQIGFRFKKKHMVLCRHESQHFENIFAIKKYFVN